MTSEPSSEVALFDTDGLAVEKKPATRKAKQEVATTDTGETTADILGRWIAICQERTGVPIPDSIRKRMGRHVKSLIQSKYKTNQIKNGLTIWTVKWMDNPLLSPTQLESLTWKFAIDQSEEGRRFQTDMKEAVNRFMGHSTAVSAGGTKKQQREQTNAQGQQGWRERYKERKRREEED